MSDFQNNLDEEIEKRRNSETESDNPTENKTKRISNSFSFRTFLSGLVICLGFTTCLIGWAWYKSKATNLALMEKLPSKTAIVEFVDGGPNVANSQTTLNIPSNIPKVENADVDTNETEEPKVEKDDSSTPSKLTENSAYGLLPKIDETTGTKPFKAYQSPFEKKTDKPLLSFVISNLGLSATKTENIIENFPPQISLSFSPYSNNLELLTDTAQKDGHEIWLSLPMETRDYPLNDPGPSTLLINASAEKNQARLHNILGSTQGYVGFISPTNHIFKTEDANVNPSVKEIFERGLAIIDSNMSIRSFIGGLADRNDYPHAQNNLWLDDNLSPSSLNQNIRKITEYGEKNKNIIVMLRPYPSSLKAVQKFLNSNAADKFELAPVSAQLKNNY